MARPGISIVAFASLLAVLPLGGCYEYDANVEPTPIKFEVVLPGRGPAAVMDDIVTVAYKVQTPDGRIIIEDDDCTFTLGRGAVIAGFDMLVTGMQLGEKRVAECPPRLHWGRSGYGEGSNRVPPNTDLRIFVELLKIS